MRKDAYTLQRPEHKNFPRNLYTVNEVGDLWELDLANMGSLASNNGGYRQILNAIDVFSKYTYSVPTRSKAGEVM